MRSRIVTKSMIKGISLSYQKFLKSASPLDAALKKKRKYVLFFLFKIYVVANAVSIILKI